jgi:two-component system sensor kinase FixL
VNRAADPRMVEFAVRDSGPGISPEIRSRLFQPFASTKLTGMGLGLSISRSIIEAHGGRIWAMPARAGAGAEFRFTVPVFMEEGNDD